jgi:hypothetical protein
MRRTLIPLAVGLLTVACLRMPLQAAEPDTLTLSCKGTQTNKIGPKIEPDVSITFIFNLATGRVSSSIDAFGELTIKILSATDVTILFAGDSPGWGFGGVVDRVTGEMKAAVNDTEYGHGRGDKNNELLAEMQSGTTSVLRS